MPLSGRRDPVGELARLGDAAHERMHEGAVLLGRQPFAVPVGPFGLRDHLALGVDVQPGEQADLPVEALVRQFEAKRNAGPVRDTVPAVDRLLHVGDPVVAQPLVQRGERRHVAHDDTVLGHVRHLVLGGFEPVVVADAGFVEAPLEALGIERGRIGADLGAVQVAGDAEVEVEVLLQRGKVDHAQAAQPGRVVGLVLVHHVAGALDDARNARFADEHVVRLLGQHEAAGARQRVEARLGERRELVLAVAVGDEGKHEERQPVRRLLVERGEDARVVGVARAALEQRLGFLATVAAEVGVQQVDHGPKVAAFLDVDLEQVAQVVERGAGKAQVALLLDRSRLGVALGDDDAAQRRAVFAGHVLPGGLAPVGAEVDLAACLGGGEENAPAVVRHPHVVEVRPALGLDADRGAQVHVHRLRLFGAHFAPPLEVPRLPVLERALQRPVARQVDVVRDALVVVDARHG